MFRVFALIFLAMTAIQGRSAELTVLTYHDVLPDPGNNIYAVSRSAFVAQMDYLEQNGYRPVSLKLLEKVQRGEARLPHKAVVLTFDDGLESYHKFVVPVLKIYGFPSLASIVTGWMDGKNIPPEYLGKLMNWDEVRQVSQSPLVEIISHTNNLHYGIQSNPQGNTAAASITRQYFPIDDTYESEAAFRKRIRDDLDISTQRLQQEVGYLPKAIAWPYGYYDRVMVEEANRLGMQFHFSLDDAPATTDQFPLINRKLVLRDSNITEVLTRHPGASELRFVEINLDTFSGASSERQEQLLSALLDRLQSLHVNTIVVSPFSADFSKTYFPNHQLPVAQNLLNRVLHQVRTRLNVRHLCLKLPGNLPVRDINDMYTDLARLNLFTEVVFRSRPKTSNLESISKTIKYFRPNVKFGIMGNTYNASDDGFYDFVIAPVKNISSHQTLAQEVAKLQQIPLPIYILLNSESDTGTLVNAMKILRSMGVRHFGYKLASYTADTPNQESLGKELAASSINR